MSKRIHSTETKNITVALLLADYLKTQAVFLSCFSVCLC